MRNEKLFLSLHKNLREDNNFPQELMRRYWISWSAMLLLFASCGGNKANNTEEMVVADSMTLNDSVAVLDSIAAESKTATESFSVIELPNSRIHLCPRPLMSCLTTSSSTLP